MRKYLLIYLLISSSLVGCAQSGVLRGSGEVAPAPYGFVAYCAQHPDRAECGGTK